MPSRTTVIPRRKCAFAHSAAATATAFLCVSSYGTSGWSHGGTPLSSRRRCRAAITGTFDSTSPLRIHLSLEPLHSTKSKALYSGKKEVPQRTGDVTLFTVPEGPTAEDPTPEGSTAAEVLTAEVSTAEVSTPEVSTQAVEGSDGKSINNIFGKTSSNSLLALSFGIFLLLVLVASPDLSNDSAIKDGIPLQSVATMDREIEEVERLVAVVVESTLPTNPADVLAIAAGEALSGVAASASGFFYRKFGLPGAQTGEGALEEAFADSDYFLTRAAARPLLASLGLSEELASVAAVLLASVPYEFVKNNGVYGMARKAGKVGISCEIDYVEDGDAKFEARAAEPSFDGKEVFADIMKWLEYDVLKTEFAGMTSLAPGLEPVLFGFLAAVSAKFYADVIGLFEEKEENSDAARSPLALTPPSMSDISAYLKTGFGSAALFGSFEALRNPFSSFARNLLSGGIDSCLGSARFDMCMETYAVVNPPGPTSEAQLRALVAAIIGIVSRAPGAADVAEVGEEALANATGEFRALIVRAVSAQAGMFQGGGSFYGTADTEAQFRAVIISLYSFERAFFDGLDRGAVANIYLAEEQVRAFVVSILSYATHMYQM